MTNIADLPEELWISCTTDANREWMRGEVRGQHPDFGRVRHIPRIDHDDIYITEVNITIDNDGTIHRMDDTQ
ncbi:hypothetical protein [Streptomyces sp. AC495_CC817]|uniref:hypothetical protein n=1 Tax=Streptomyces sp. AC495_CC817 TaxID=2823900 RepID=UPI001C2600AA|nr:hypothetical protein [Streptomyces sp. AC495_CC817]